MKWIIGQVNTKEWRRWVPIKIPKQWRAYYSFHTKWILNSVHSLHCSCCNLSKGTGICRIQLRKQNMFGSNCMWKSIGVHSVQCTWIQWRRLQWSELNYWASKYKRLKTRNGYWVPIKIPTQWRVYYSFHTTGILL